MATKNMTMFGVVVEHNVCSQMVSIELENLVKINVNYHICIAVFFVGFMMEHLYIMSDITYLCSFKFFQGHIINDSRPMSISNKYVQLQIVTDTDENLIPPSWV